MGRVVRMPSRGVFSTHLLPRQCAPVDVMVGDLVSVEFKPDRGIIMSKRGRVHVIRDQGRVRRFETEDGAVLFAWQIGGDATVRVTLIERAEYKGETLFDVEA